jgi:hypothetical protein
MPLAQQPKRRDSKPSHLRGFCHQDHPRARKGLPPIGAGKIRGRANKAILVLPACIVLDSIGYTMGVPSINVPEKANMDR